MAQNRFVKFKYADTGFDATAHGSTGTVGQVAFRGNSPYDPDVLLGGVQPYQFDALVSATGFAYFLAYSSKITVTFYKTAPADDIILTVVPSNSASLAYVNSDDLRVMPYSRQKRMADNHNQITSITNYCSVRRLRPVALDDDYIGTYADNPDRVWYWHIITDANTVGTDHEVFIDVKITYYCKLTRVGNADES